LVIKKFYLSCQTREHESDQFGWRQGFLAEGDVQAFIFFFCFRHAADDNDGNLGIDGTKFADKIGTAGSGEHVIGDDDPE